MTNFHGQGRAAMTTSSDGNFNPDTFDHKHFLPDTSAPSSSSSSFAAAWAWAWASGAWASSYSSSWQSRVGCHASPIIRTHQPRPERTHGQSGLSRISAIKYPLFEIYPPHTTVIIIIILISPIFSITISAILKHFIEKVLQLFIWIRRIMKTRPSGLRLTGLEWIVGWWPVQEL